MNNKKKQAAVVAMATVLSVTSIASPLPVMAQEVPPVPPAIMQEESKQQETAPDISLPKKLQATAGMTLQEITLPEDWTWADDSTLITAETAEYPARFSVDDVTYDYSNAEGYNAEGHYVERMVAVIVEPAKQEPAELVQKKSYMLTGNTPTAFNSGDIAINATNFPDETFRNYVKENFDTDKNGSLSAAEIAGITVINVGGNASIEDLTGIEHFTALTYLNCYNTGISDLDVSTNTNLTRLDCDNTGISDLDVSKNTKLTTLYCNNNEKLTNLTVAGAIELTTLYCYNTGLRDLDVSKNTNLILLSCVDNKTLTNLTVAGAIELTSLHCYNTGIRDLDVSKNTKLTYLDCDDNKKLTNLTVAGAIELTTLYCDNTGITSLDVSTNTKLTTLYCDNTGITSLDVSTNTKLTRLDCNNNEKLTNLTVAGAIELTYLYCYNTGIRDLDVSKNTNLILLSCDDNKTLTNLTVAGAIELTELWCDNTGIRDLDVSKNTKLTYLDCGNNALAYLNIGTNNKLSDIIKTSLKPVDLKVKEDSFNITDKFTGIDKGKISNVTGADYNNGVMSNYSIGTPITYTYDCGTSKHGKETIDVTMNLIDTREDSTISVTENLSKTYDKIAVNATPNVNKTGSSGEVSFVWKKKVNDTNWEVITSEPIDVGTYQVTAILSSDSNYKGATSSPAEFTISQAEPSYKVPQDLEATFGQTLADVKLPAGFSWEESSLSVGNAGVNQFNVIYTPIDTKNYKIIKGINVKVKVNKATNSWNKTPDISGWIYGETASVPMADAKYGDVTFSYSNSENGTFTSDKPTKAGIWYVKAVVAGTENYTGMEAILDFTIAPKSIDNNSSIIISNINSDKDVEKLIIKDGDKELVQGTDYEVEKKQKGNNVEVVITFKGNYTGTITESYTVNVDKPKDSVSVSTGDTTHTGLLAMITLLSASCIVFLTGKKRRKEF